MSEVEEKDSYLEFDNLPNRLTIFRIFLIPVVVICLYFSNTESDSVKDLASKLSWAAGWLFVIASVTDFFDGYIARKRNIVTVFGSFLDPIADKFLIVSCLIMLQSLDRIPAFLVIILILREMYMTSLRLLATTEGISVPVSFMGKLKTTVQMMGIPMLIVNEPWKGIPMPMMGTVLIYFAGILSMWSAVQYSNTLLLKFKLARKEKKNQKKNLKAQKKNKENTDESTSPSNS